MSGSHNSKPPLSWIDGKFKESEENFPVMVTYSEAVKYAEWAKKRLPTEEEWEKAARGTGLELSKTPDGYYYYNEKPTLYIPGEIILRLRKQTVSNSGI